MIALSTAFKRALVGVKIQDKTAYRELDSSCKHSENILPAIDSALNELKYDINDNDSFGVVIGPGSFTGLRIGVSLVKGLTATNNKPIVTLTTNELMAYSFIKNYHPTTSFVTIIDGLSGFYFVAKFSKDGEKLEEEKLVTGQISGDVVVGLSEEDIAFANFKIAPSAKELLEVCNILLEKGQITTKEKILPLYLRKSQAEANMEEKKL